MNYSEFKNKYAWTLKNYSGTYELYRDDFYGYLIGKCDIVHYVKRGNRWFCDFNETRDTTPAFYFNTIDAIPFFRGLGGYERVTCGYCVRGYVPIEITSISPDRKEKTVRKFKLF